MRKQWYYFKYMCREITEYNKSLWLWLSVRIIAQTARPLLQLLLSAKVIQWLLEGIAVEIFLTELAIWIAAICVLDMVDRRLEFYFDKECDIFRMSVMKKITKAYYEIDYPLIISEEGQKNYAEASDLVGSPSQLFGRFIREFYQHRSTFQPCCQDTEDSAQSSQDKNLICTNNDFVTKKP